MIRTQIILDESTHTAVRSFAFKRHQSMSKTIRELLHESLAIKTSPKKKLTFTFIGIGRSKRRNKTSQEHDLALGEKEW